MIRITRMDGKQIVLNAEWIRSVENTPDTLITLTTGETIMVKETLDDVVDRFKAYKRDTFRVVKGEGST